MNLDDLMFWIIVAGAVSIIGPILFWALLAFGLFKFASNANRQFEQQLQQAMQLGRQMPHLPDAQRAAAQAQMTAALMNLHNQRAQFDRLQQQKYDLRMGELMNVASSAGIDWRPPGP